MEMKGSRLIEGILEDVFFEINEENISEEKINDETEIGLISLKIDKKDIFVFPSFENFKVGNIPPILSKLRKNEKRIIIITLRKFGSSLIAFDFDLNNALISEVIKSDVLEGDNKNE